MIFFKLGCNSRVVRREVTIVDLKAVDNVLGLPY